MPYWNIHNAILSSSTVDLITGQTNKTNRRYGDLVPTPREAIIGPDLPTPDIDFFLDGPVFTPSDLELQWRDALKNAGITLAMNQITLLQGEVVDGGIIAV